MKQLAIKYKHLIIQFTVLLLFIFISFIANRFPNGYTIVGGDFYQLINIRENFMKFFYSWTNQQGSGYYFIATPAFFYYAIFYLIEVVGFPENIISSFYIFFFLYGSYISFYFGVKILFRKISGKYINYPALLLCSLIYALNSFTLSIFTYSWGFSHHLLIYIFIPLLTSLFIRFLIYQESKVIAWFTIILAFSTIAFVNVAFLLVLVIFFILILIIAFSLKIIAFNKKFGLKLIMLISMAFLVLFYVIIPFYFGMKNQIGNLSNDPIMGQIGNWLRYTSISFSDLFQMLIMRNGYFPQKNIDIPYTWAWQALIFLPFIAVLLLTLTMKKWNAIIYKLFMTFEILLIFWIMLCVRITPPFAQTNLILYKYSFMVLLRSSDKVFVFLPFIIVFLIYIGLFNKSRNYIILLCGLILLIPMPFYLGGIQTNLSASFKKGENYRNAQYSYLVKIPIEYRNLENIFNNEKGDFRIQSLPYSVINSIGWSQYPAWRMIGFDVTQSFVNKNMNQANIMYNTNSDWIYAEQFNKNYDGRWLLRFSAFLNNRYILYHKDVRKDFIDASIGKIKSLAKNGDLRLIETNKYFDLYKISKRYFLPHIYSSTAPAVAFGDIKDLGNLVTIDDFSVKKGVFLTKLLSNRQIRKLLKQPTARYFVLNNLTRDAKNKNPYQYFLPSSGKLNILIRANKLKNNKNIKSILANIDGKSIEKRISNRSDDWVSAGMIVLKKGQHRLRFFNLNNNRPSSTIKDSTIVFWRNDTRLDRSPKISFIKNDPTKYTLRTTAAKRSYYLIFSESFHPYWRAYYGKISWWQALWRKPISENNHFLINGYANAWYINKLSKQEITILFWPQSLFYIGLIILGLTLTGCLLYLVVKWRKDKNESSTILLL